MMWECGENAWVATRVSVRVKGDQVPRGRSAAEEKLVCVFGLDINFLITFGGEFAYKLSSGRGEW